MGATITGRWGKPSEVLLDLVADADGTVRGVANPGTQNAPIRRGHFDASAGALQLEGEHTRPDGNVLPFRIDGRLEGRTLRLNYQYGEKRGSTEVSRVEDYQARPLTFMDRLKLRVDDLHRWLTARTRPTGEENARKLRERGESLDSIIFRDAVAADIPALAELHVTTWNATYNTSRGPTIATRTWQWTEVFAKENRRDFVLVLEDRTGRLIGFTWGKPTEGEFEGNLSKIYLRWEYHGLGLGRRMMVETARRFFERGIRSFILFAERSNPTLESTIAWEVSVCSTIVVSSTARMGGALSELSFPSAAPLGVMMAYRSWVKSHAIASPLLPLLAAVVFVCACSTDATIQHSAGRDSAGAFIVETAKTRRSCRCSDTTARAALRLSGRRGRGTPRARDRAAAREALPHPGCAPFTCAER